MIRAFYWRRVFLTVILLISAMNLCQASFKVLPWDGCLQGLAYRNGDTFIPLTLTFKKISRAYTLDDSAKLDIYDYEEAMEAIADKREPEPVFSISLPTAKGQSLLVLSKSKKEYAGLAIPYSEQDIPFNALSCFNFTRYELAVEIDGQRHFIESSGRITLPFDFQYGKTEAFRSRMFARIEDRWKLIHNGFIPLKNDARILYFISSDFQTQKDRDMRPMSFTYVYEAQTVRPELIDEIEYESTDDLTGVMP